MSIAKLRQIARLDLPFNVSNDDEVDELRVLMSAGLIVGLTLRLPQAPQRGSDGCYHPSASLVIRVLAITPDGRRLLQRSSDTGHADRVGIGMHENGGESRPTSH